MTRTTPLRARRLNLPGRQDEDSGDAAPRDAPKPEPEVDDDLASMREAFGEGREPRDPTPSPHYTPATTLSPPWLHRDDHEPPTPPAPPAEAAVVPSAAPATPHGHDEWESLRQSGNEKPAKAKSSSSGVSRTLLELPILIVVAALIAFVVRTFVAQAFYIPSGSMEPQLQINDRIVVSKLAYRLHEPRRGDIVVFESPTPTTNGDDENRSLPVKVLRGIGEAVGLVQPSTEDFIKRVIGLPGETVEGRDNKIFVNGRVLVEPYLPPGEPTSSFGPITVPEDHLWVMGDNRDGSSDSRSFGAIRQSTVVGRTVVRVWPAGDASFL